MATEEQSTMWDYWQEHPRGKTSEQELKELCFQLAQLLHEATYRIELSPGQIDPWLEPSEVEAMKKGLSYVDS